MILPHLKSSSRILQVELLLESIFRKSSTYRQQCSHQNLQAEGHKYYLMTTPIILNIVSVSTKHLLHVYHCQQSILLNVHSALYSEPRQFLSSSSSSGC